MWLDKNKKHLEWHWVITIPQKISARVFVQKTYKGDIIQIHFGETRQSQATHK